jgi:phosphoglycolate phosphatase-like HAD superfamily hydrolase
MELNPNSATMPTLLALDFDGVICDGRLEYFQSGWRTYCRVWNAPTTDPPAGLSDRYRRLAAVVETDRDVVLLVRALMLQIPDHEILETWYTLAPQLLAKDQVTEARVVESFIQVRDEWIARDRAGWLACQPFYPGIRERLQEILASPVKLVIVTNRSQRFAQELLQVEGIFLPDDQVFGKHGDRPKFKVLQHLKASKNPTIWFVEDHVKALHLVEQQPDLRDVQMFLTDWGLNTPAVRASIQTNPRIRLLSLTQFLQDFTAWMP